MRPYAPASQAQVASLRRLTLGLGVAALILAAVALAWAGSQSWAWSRVGRRREHEVCSATYQCGRGLQCTDDGVCVPIGAPRGGGCAALAEGTTHVCRSGRWVPA